MREGESTQLGLVKKVYLLSPSFIITHKELCDVEWVWRNSRPISLQSRIIIKNVLKVEKVDSFHPTLRGPLRLYSAPSSVMHRKESVRGDAARRFTAPFVPEHFRSPLSISLSPPTATVCPPVRVIGKTSILEARQRRGKTIE